MGFTAVVLAHQGGWDEMLLVATPVLIFIVLFRVANARSAAQADQDDGVDAHPRRDADDSDPADDDLFTAADDDSPFLDPDGDR